MAKGYWIARVDVDDPEGYKAYVEAATPAFARYGARFLARGGASHRLEGEMRARNVVIEFPSVEAARACFESETYQRAADIRRRFATADMIVVEGLD